MTELSQMIQPAKMKELPQRTKLAPVICLRGLNHFKGHLLSETAEPNMWPSAKITQLVQVSQQPEMTQST